MTDPDRSANPFFQTWTTPDGAPPFDRIRPEHFREAYARAFAEHDAEVAAIAAQPEPPDFANTIAALELSGRLLERVGSAFYLLVGAHSDAALLEIEREIAPQLARHWNRINTNEELFRRIDALMRGADGLNLDAEQKRVLERYHVTFRRAGAALQAPVLAGVQRGAAVRAGARGRRRSVGARARTLLSWGLLGVGDSGRVGEQRIHSL